MKVIPFLKTIIDVIVLLLIDIVFVKGTEQKTNFADNF